jgi:pyrimidine operon attenuation protein/uracil phosphoribosyltransferase
MVMTSGRGRIRARILDASAIQQALNRIAHQILERNPNPVALVGIGQRGEILAKRLADIFRNAEGKTVAIIESGNSEKMIETGPRTVVLVDDLIFTGHAAYRAVADLLKHESVDCIQLAVLVDQGNRQLPIHADYVGKNIPTASDEYVEVRLKELDNEEQVLILEKH